MSANQSETAEQATHRPGVTPVAEVVEFLEFLAPPALSSPEAPYGLQAGTPTAAVRTIVVAPMATQSALACASARGGALILTAAPLVTAPLTAVRRDDPIGNKLATILEQGSCLYGLANSYFAAPGGFDDSLAEALGLAATGLLRPTCNETLHRIAVYVPVPSVDAVYLAAAEAGAGRLGNYSHCSFQAHGLGTWMPGPGAHPVAGQIGALTKMEEVRLEMIVPQRELQGVIAAVVEAHPYEEVAYDVIALRNPGAQFGRGRVAELPLKVSLDTVLAQVSDALAGASIRVSHRSDLPISSLAVAAGQGDGLYWPANRAGAGALVTGGVCTQDVMLAEQSATVIIDVGFRHSVAPGLRALCRQLRDTFGADGVDVVFCP
ncbi:MAG: Nif3-like dinuclear metal center hexameric protein [Armatimonadetes bacterium]|nr:Nif3-like dinuclear metal center hexameric protein [Armatimonadota bacterium]